MGRKGPKPKYGPRTLVPIRMPDSLLKRAREVASKDGESLSDLVVRSLGEAVDRIEKGKRWPKELRVNVSPRIFRDGKTGPTPTEITGMVPDHDPGQTTFVDRVRPKRWPKGRRKKR